MHCSRGVAISKSHPGSASREPSKGDSHATQCIGFQECLPRLQEGAAQHEGQEDKLYVASGMSPYSLCYCVHKCLQSMILFPLVLITVVTRVRIFASRYVCACVCNAMQFPMKWDGMTHRVVYLFRHKCSSVQVLPLIPPLCVPASTI